MRLSKICIAVVVATTSASQAWGHGFQTSLNVDGSGNPLSFSPASQAQYLNTSDAPAPYSNLFFDTWSSAPKTDSLGTPGTYYQTNDGFVQTAGPWPLYTSATFNVISPLLFSNGSGPAVPASAGTQLYIADRYPNNSDGNHPGASAGAITVTGSSSLTAGFQVSLYDTHELTKDLFLAAGTTQTYGEYGFAYDITVHFANGTVLTSGPLVDIFALNDPNLAGGAFSSASASLQSAATLALYQAAVPEPSSIVLLGAGAGAAGVIAHA